MVTVRDIVGCIKDTLYQKYPSCAFYIQGLPESADKPAFHIYLENDRSEDNTRLTTNETTFVEIVYFPPADETAADELKPIEVYSSIKQIFRKGYLEVGGRSLKVVLLRGGTRMNQIYLNVKILYVEDRPIDTQNQTVYELMGEVKIR